MPHTQLFPQKGLLQAQSFLQKGQLQAQLFLQKGQLQAQPLLRKGKLQAQPPKHLRNVTKVSRVAKVSHYWYHLIVHYSNRTKIAHMEPGV